jgi:predicted lipase
MLKTLNESFSEGKFIYTLQPILEEKNKIVVIIHSFVSALVILAGTVFVFVAYFQLKWSES